MEQSVLFDEHVAEYEAWFDTYNHVFRSEVAAILEVFPAGESLYGLEVGVGTGRFAEALGIKEGVDPSPGMREKASKRGINVRDAQAEALPYKDMSFHVVLMVFCISYFENLHAAFKEAYRVLKDEGVLIVGFIDKNSTIGEYYESRKLESVFYRHANFYSVDKIKEELRKVRFKGLTFSQTLFHSLDEIQETESPLPGYGDGSFVIIKTVK